MPTLRTAIASAVTVTWVIVMIAALINPAATAAVAAVSPVMLLVVGWLFSTEVQKREKNGDGNGTR